MKILEKALKMLEKYPLCSHCLGRQFALLGYGFENEERGNAIKMILMLMSYKIQRLIYLQKIIINEVLNISIRKIKSDNVKGIVSNENVLDMDDYEYIEYLCNVDAMIEDLQNE